MALSIAIGGKGGSGKTTIASMVVRVLLERKDGGAILAVDADPNSCFGLALGVEPAGTVAEIREQARGRPPEAGVDRLRLVGYEMQRAITEADGFDLLTMGRPEGPSCYCAVNNMLRQFLDKLHSQYQFVIIDNEAGMEHLSRRTTNNVDLLCIVAEPTAVGIVTAERIYELAGALPIAVSEIGVIWNKAGAKPQCGRWLDGVQTFGCVPADESVVNASMQGKTVFNLEADNPALSAVRGIVASKLGLGTPAGAKRQVTGTK